MNKTTYSAGVAPVLAAAATLANGYAQQDDGTAASSPAVTSSYSLQDPQANSAQDRIAVRGSNMGNAARGMRSTSRVSWFGQYLRWTEQLLQHAFW